jgi:outer membrane protein OmpA-like peptidoglycan-associated protein
LLEENKRVELSCEMPDRVSLNNNQADLIYAKAMLKRNPDLTFVIAGETNKAHNLRKGILDEFPKELHSRIFTGKRGQEEGFLLSADGLLYRPQITGEVLSMTPASPPPASIEIKTRGNIKTWKLSALNSSNRKLVSVIKEGTGNPPSSIKWDMLDNKGNFILSETPVELELSVEDITGQSKTFYTNEPLSLKVEKSTETDKKLLLVQFIFDEPSEKNLYLTDRISVIAETLSDMILKNKTTEIIIEGTTDIIGTDDRNMKLSQERADMVSGLLISHIAALWDMSVPQTLSRIASFGAVIRPVGTGSSNKPDNGTPEKRRINRSVTISVRSEAWDNPLEGRMKRMGK